MVPPVAIVVGMLGKHNFMVDAETINQNIM